MKKQHLIHVRAIAIISLVVIVLYLLIPAPSSQPTQVVGNRFVQISSATWGLNCNFFIQQAMRQPQAKPVADASGNIPPAPAPLALVKRNNVLLPISELCNGQNQCSFVADIAGLGDPLASCYKELEIGYRCFELDALTRKTFKQGENVVIDCTENAEKAPTSTPNAS